jgi:hypothetical protein
MIRSEKSGRIGPAVLCPALVRFAVNVRSAARSRVERCALVNHEIGDAATGGHSLVVNKSHVNVFESPFLPGLHNIIDRPHIAIDVRPAPTLVKAGNLYVFDV